MDNNPAIPVTAYMSLNGKLFDTEIEAMRNSLQFLKDEQLECFSDLFNNVSKADAIYLTQIIMAKKDKFIELLTGNVETNILKIEEEISKIS